MGLLTTYVTIVPGSSMTKEPVKGKSFGDPSATYTRKRRGANTKNVFVSKKKGFWVEIGYAKAVKRK